MKHSRLSKRIISFILVIILLSSSFSVLADEPADQAEEALPAAEAAVSAQKEVPGEKREAAAEKAEPAPEEMPGAPAAEKAEPAAEESPSAPAEQPEAPAEKPAEEPEAQPEAPAAEPAEEAPEQPAEEPEEDITEPAPEEQPEAPAGEPAEEVPEAPAEEPEAQPEDDTAEPAPAEEPEEELPAEEPRITWKKLKDVTVAEGRAKIVLEASCPGKTLRYRWQQLDTGVKYENDVQRREAWTDIPGAEESTLILEGIEEESFAAYACLLFRCVISTDDDAEVSEEIRLLPDPAWAEADMPADEDPLPEEESPEALPDGEEEGPEEVLPAGALTENGPAANAEEPEEKPEEEPTEESEEPTEDAEEQPEEEPTEEDAKTTLSDDIDSGNCGANVTWTLSADYVLTVSGSGDMDDFYNNNSWTSNAPWYSYRSKIRSAVIGSGVTGIGSGAFYECGKMTSVTIPAGVTGIGSYAFSSCNSLTSVNLPDSVTRIDCGAFCSCYRLTSVSIPAGVTSLSSSVFSDCSLLQSVTFPSELKSIGENAFWHCLNLTSVSIPAGVTSLGNGAFGGCSGLTSVSIPASVTAIDRNPFRGCILTSLTVASENAYYKAVGNSLFRKADNTLIYACSSVVPEGTECIGAFAFSDCSYEMITVPASVTSIENYAFYDCTYLKAILYAGTKAQWNTLLAHTGSSGNDNLLNAIVQVNDADSEEIASGTCGTNVTWSLSTDYVLTVSGSGKMDDYYTLSNISSAPWSFYRNEIRSAVIESGVTSIGYVAFYGCSKMTSVTIPVSVSSIGGSAFDGCTALKTAGPANDGNTYNITYGWTENIPDSAFYGCSSLISVTFPESLTGIGYEAFHNCSGLTALTIPKNVASINSRSFTSCSGLVAITVAPGNTEYRSSGDCLIRNEDGVLILGCKNSAIPAGISGIGDYAFYNCTGLTSVTIPDSVTSIGDYAFYDCNGLTSVSIPAGVTSLGSHVFSYCDSLRSVTFPNTLKSIGASAFYDCNGLTSIALPDSVTSLGNGAFGGCRGLTAVNIPAGVTVIDGNPFSGCQLTSLTVASENAYYKAADNCLLRKADNTLISACSSVIPEGTECIGAYALNPFFEIITVPASVTSIEAYASLGCSSLKDILYTGTQAQWNTLLAHTDSSGNSELLNAAVHVNAADPVKVASGSCGSTLTWALSSDGVLTISGTGDMKDYQTNINDYVPWIDYRNSIRSVVIQSGCTGIGSSAFSGCSNLNSVSLPSGLKSIGRGAFWDCSGLTSLSLPASLTKISGEVFTGCDGLKTAGPAGGGYDLEFGWTTSIPDMAFLTDPFFKIASPFTRIVLPAGLKSIGSSAFYGCNNLTSVTVPAGVTDIGEWAFCSCSGLTSVSIPASVTGMGGNVFAYCDGLKTAGPAGGGYDLEFGWTTSIPENAFYYYRSSDSVNDSVSPFTRIVLPTGLKSIGSYAFYGCDNLTSIKIPAGLKSIGIFAFFGCSSLTSLLLPASVTDMGQNVFTGCDGLKTAGPAGGGYNLEFGWTTSIPENALTSSDGYGKTSPFTRLVLPADLKSIGEKAFEGCNKLTSVTIPAGVTLIGNLAFSRCTGLTSVTIPAGVTDICPLAFAYCTGLKSVTIPTGVKHINTAAFKDCTGLTSVVIRSRITELSDDLFSGCTALKEITFPGSVTGVDKDTFTNCNSLADVYFDGSQTQWRDLKAQNAVLARVRVHYINMNIPMDAPRIKVSGTTATVSWAREGSASGYKVYVRKDNDPTPKVYTVNKGSTLKSTYKGIQPGHLYCFSVAPVKFGEVCRESAETSYHRALGKPAPKMKVKNNVLTFTWSKVAGATGYRMTVTDKDGVQSVKMLSAGAKKTVLTVSPCGTYTVSLVAYTSIETSAAAVKTTTVNIGTPTKFTYKLKVGVNMLKWKAAKCAGGYEIYRSDSPEGPFECIGTVRTAYYYDRAIERGMTYYYKVRAVNTKEFVYGSSPVEGNFTAVRTITAK